MLRHVELDKMTEFFPSLLIISVFSKQGDPKKNKAEFSIYT